MEGSSIHMFVGIKTSYGKFFNVEKFNFQLSSNATSLRQKQTFAVEFDEKFYYFRSHLKTYLSAHELGEVSCKTPADARGPKEAFMIEYVNGFVCLKSVHSGKYLSADDNNITCKAAAAASPNERFELMINVHPAISFRTAEGRFIRLDDKSDEVYADRQSQFGKTLLTLEYESEGRFAIRVSSGKYFSTDANGVVSASAAKKDTPAQHFYLEFFGRKLAIRSVSNGKFLIPDGAKGNLKAKKDAPTPRELMDMVKCDAQVAIRAHNGKYATTQGLNVVFNRPEIGFDEVFITENDGDRYAVKNNLLKYWTVKDAALVADGAAMGPNELFVLEYTPNGKTYFKGGAGGKYISAKALGGVRMANENADQEQFDLFLLNRPVIVLRTKLLSYVGTSGDKLTANKNYGETFALELTPDGAYFLRNYEGHHLSIGDDDKLNLVAGKESPLHVELCKGKVAFKTEAGRYLQVDNNGNLQLGGKVRGDSELFEF
eukprot:TRINITY_DN2529_c0_g1_i1.p1 TRINITY_DN2529_c0_g1~~TRINITY_DN2529_c0_g1_i1.p1  ORF type:complete len:488 (+),score=120.54 TRINITY_DN2529_c0_g1_i1:132-1595(+)